MAEHWGELPRFKSFFIAGLECTAALAKNRRRLDLLGASKHDVYCRDDYRMMKEYGILTVREGFSWHGIDRGGGRYDFSRYELMLASGLDEGVEQIWDLCHFDYPDRLDPFAEEFVVAYAEHARRCLEMIRRYWTDGILYIIPLNEISFFAWIGADRGRWAPYRRGSHNGFRFKQQLVRACLAAMDAIWSEDRNIRFIHADPCMRRVARDPASAKARNHAWEFNEEIRFEAYDMIAGRRHPELGGDPRYLNVIGMNYYFHNQEWVMSQGKESFKYQTIAWDDPARVSLEEMIREVYERYRRPIFISEAGSYGEPRPQWWERTLREIDEALSHDLPVVGICAYPALDQPPLAGFLYPNSGLWDFEVEDETCQRIPHRKTLDVIKPYVEKWKVYGRGS